MAGRMRTSRAGLDLIKSFEGFRPRAVALEEGRGFVIGYGHTAGARAGLRVSEDDAEAILRDYDLKPIEAALNTSLLAPVSQNEFDALVSFVFSIGLDAFGDSEVFALLNAGAKLRAAEAVSAWRKARIGGRMIVVDGLVRRRAAEQALFLEPDQGRTPVTSAVARPQIDFGAAILRRREPARKVDTLSGQPVIAEPDEAEAPARDRTETSVEPVDTAPEAAARAVGERLSRILGEEAGALSAPSSPTQGPSVDEITAAISALAENVADPEPDAGETGASPSGRAVRGAADADGEPENGVGLPPADPHPGNRAAVVDDLETVSVDPEAALGDAGNGIEKPNWPSVILFALAAFCGALIAAWGFSHITELLASDAPVTRESDLYAGPFAILLGGVIFLIMLYYLARALFSPPQ